MKVRYCPNCKHKTAQEKGFYLLDKDPKGETTILEVPKMRFSMGRDGFMCLTCGKIIIEYRVDRAY
jgi:hypothetical protein